MSRSFTPPRLILVDGFAGTGKSTTAQRLWLHLTHSGHDAAWWHEHQAGHPIFSYAEVEELLDVRPEAFEERLRTAWTGLARHTAAPITVLEGSFFQVTVGVLLAMNVAPRRIERLLLDIDRTVAPLGAALVHLFYEDTRRGLLAIREHRGAYWLDGMTSIVGKSPYGRRHRVRDVEGLIAFYRAQRAIIDAVFPALSMRRTAIEISGGRWNGYLRRARAFLRIGTPARETPLTPRRLLRHAGQYRGKAGARVIATDGSRLYLHDGLLAPQPLVPARDGSFEVESLPIAIRFTSGAGGVSQRLSVHNQLLNAQPARASFSRKAPSSR